MPSTGPTDASGYGGVVVLSGANVAFQGGRVLQDNLSLACKYGAQNPGGGSCNFGVDVFPGMFPDPWQGEP